MKKILIVLLALLFAVPALSASAQARRSDTTVTVDLKDLDEYSRNQILNRMKNKEGSGVGIMDSVKDTDPASIKVWADLISGTIKTICHDLSIEANEFIKTPVGMIVAGTIIYKVVGKDALYAIKGIVFGIIGWVMTMSILYFIARKFIIPRKLKRTKVWNDKDKGKITETEYYFEIPYEFRQSSDSKTVAVSFLVGTSIVSTIAAMVIVL